MEVGINIMDEQREREREREGENECLEFHCLEARMGGGWSRNWEGEAREVGGERREVGPLEQDDQGQERLQRASSQNSHTTVRPRDS